MLWLKEMKGGLRPCGASPPFGEDSSWSQEEIAGGSDSRCRGQSRCTEQSRTPVLGVAEDCLTGASRDG